MDGECKFGCKYLKLNISKYGLLSEIYQEVPHWVDEGTPGKLQEQSY